MGPLLTFADGGHQEPSFEDSDTSSLLSPLEPGPLLFEHAPFPPRLVFHPDTDHSPFGSQSRIQSDLMMPTAASNDRLTAPPAPRRHSFHAQRSEAIFSFSPESGPSNPDTPSSPFPSSPYSSDGMTPDLPLRHLQVASPAGVHAANLRRKRKAKFQCTYTDVCQATFTTKHNLQNHLNSHEGRRPYACVSCGADFTTLNVKRRHEKNCKGLVEFVSSLASPS